MDIHDFDPCRDGDALRSFAKEVWDRPTSDAYWNWWLACPSLDGVVAYGEDGRLVAVLFGIRRRYMVGDHLQECLEPFDWFSRPDFVGSAIGLFLMRRLMKRGCSIVVLGANRIAADVMRVLGFQEVAEGRTYWLPFGQRALIERGRDPLTARAFSVAGQAMRATWRRPRPVAAELRLVNGISDRVSPTSGAALRKEVAPAPDAALLRWWRDASPEVGIFLPFQVLVKGSPAIWALARVAGSDVSRRSWLLEWHDYSDDQAVSDWALTSILQSLVRLGSTSIHAMTTDPNLHRQLEERRFRIDGRPVALIWRPKGGSSITGPVRLMGSQADNSYLPLA